MTQLRLTAHCETPIERVFEMAMDFKRYPEWNVNYIEVGEVTGPVDQVGTEIYGVLKILGRRLEGFSEIVEVERPRLLTTKSQTDDGHNRITYRFEPDETGTKAEFEFEYELRPGFFGQLMDRLFVERAIERDLRHSLENSKAFVEEPVPQLA